MASTTRKNKPVDAFDGISLSDYQRTVAKARMAQAEAIASGFVALVKAVSNGIAAIRTVFLKPVHH